MRLAPLPFVLLAASASPLLAQGGNPFRIDLGTHRSVEATYGSDADIVVGGRKYGHMKSDVRMLATPAAMLVTMHLVQTDESGKTESADLWSLRREDAEVTENASTEALEEAPALRPHMAREFDALDAAARARFVANMRKLPDDAWSSLGVLNPMALGLSGTPASVAGIPCTMVEYGRTRTCLAKAAPSLFLRITPGQDGEDSALQAYDASAVRFDVPIPATAFAYPAGRRVTKVDFDWSGDWAATLYQEKNGDASEQPTLPALARWVTRYLASADAVKDLDGAHDEP